MWAAGEALIRGDQAEHDRLIAAAQELDWADEAARVAARPSRITLPPITILPEEQRAIVAAGEPGTVTDIPVSKNVVSLDSHTTDLDTGGRRRPCGRRHLLRVGGTRTVRRRFLCGARRCETCRPRVITRKSDAVKSEQLYAIQVEKGNDWVALDKRLRRMRDRGEAAEYVRIPRGSDQLLIVSEVPIGPPIEHDTMKHYMLDAKVEWGSITSSKGWRPEHVSMPDDIVDEGEITSSDEWVSKVATSIGLRPTVTNDDGDIDFGDTTDQQHERIKYAACVRPPNPVRVTHTGGELHERWQKSRAA